MTELSHEMVNFFPEIVESIILCIDKILHNKYLENNYITVSNRKMSEAGLEIKKLYGRIVALRDTFLSVQKYRIGAETSR